MRTNSVKEMRTNSVKEKKPKIGHETLRQYNKNIRYNYKPSGWFTKHMPLTVVPIISSSLAFIFIIIFIAYVVLTTPQYATFTGERKGEIVAVTSFVLLAPNVFAHYLLNSLLVHPIGKKLHYKTSKSNFTLIGLNLFLFLSIGLHFVLKIFINESSSNTTQLANWFIPTWLFVSGVLCTLLYRSFNELYKRDKDGNIIMSDSYVRRMEAKAINANKTATVEKELTNKTKIGSTNKKETSNHDDTKNEESNSEIK